MTPFVSEEMMLEGKKTCIGHTLLLSAEKENPELMATESLRALPSGLPFHREEQVNMQKIRRYTIKDIQKVS
jgi:hypothetical protein